VLFEVVVALTILAVAGTTVATLAAQAGEAVRRARGIEIEVRKASAFMDAVALWPQADLDRHLGDRAEGPWRLRVDRPRPVLYVVTLTDTASGQKLLRTTLYRPQLVHETP
jgi:hypothetical protein